MEFPFCISFSHLDLYKIFDEEFRYVLVANITKIDSLLCSDVYTSSRPEFTEYVEPNISEKYQCSWSTEILSAESNS